MPPTKIGTLFLFCISLILPLTSFSQAPVENFLVTPHIGGSAKESILAMGIAAIDGLDNNKIPEINFD